MSKLKIKIKDVNWTTEILDDNIYIKQHDDTSLGITDSDTKNIHFRKSAFSESLVRHELMHAYVSSCCVDSMSEMEPEDMEELCCEIIGMHGKQIMNLSARVFKRLKKLI